MRLQTSTPRRLLRIATHGRGMWECDLDEKSMPDVQIFVRNIKAFHYLLNKLLHYKKYLMEDWNLEQAQEPRFNMQHNGGIHME